MSLEKINDGYIIRRHAGSSLTLSLYSREWNFIKLRATSSTFPRWAREQYQSFSQVEKYIYI